jgi:hypothetical protein
MSATRKSPSKLKIAAVVESPSGPRGYLRETIDRYHTARERVGDHPPQQLNWLVSVLQRDPGDLRTALESGDSDFRLELAWFGHASDPWSTGPAEEILEALAQLRVTLSNFRPDWSARIAFPTEGQITRHFDIVPKARRVRWAGTIESYFSSDHFPTALLLAAADVIQEEGLRVRQCARAECGRLFVKRKRGIYCSNECSQKVRDERFRKSHSAAELKERRHRHYVATVKRRRGPVIASKVQPRRPTKGTD